MWKVGHPASECPARLKQQASLATVNNSNGNFENNVFYSALSSEASNRSNTWVIDNGASRNITGFKELLDSIEEDYVNEVTIGDDTNYPVKGIGTCTTNLKSRISIELTKVHYIPSIKRNLSLYPPLKMKDTESHLWREKSCLA